MPVPDISTLPPDPRPTRPHRGRLGAALAILTVTLALWSPAGAQTRYVAFGNSITSGVGDETEQGYPPRLEEMLQQHDPGSTVENAGVPGETTTEGLTRLESVLDREPGVLLLMEGTNDVSREVSSETIVFNLEEMAMKTESAGWEIVHATLIPRREELGTPEKRDLNGVLNRRLRASAGTREVDLADPFEVFGSTPDVFERFYSDDPDDPVGHPNGEGYELLASVFRDLLVGIDAVPPVPGPIHPRPNSEDVPADTLVEVDLWDFGTGIDLLDTTLLIDGREVATEVTGGGRHAELTHRPVDPLSGEVVVGLRSRDLASPINTVDREISRFVIEGTTFLEGDLDESGRVDGLDLVRFARRFGTRRGDSGYDDDADFNDDGSIDGEDLAVLASNFGRSS